MHSHDPARMGEARGELGDRQRRRVRRQDAFGRHDVLEPREELALRRGVLDDRLDDELRDARVGQCDDARDSRDRGVGVALLEPPLGHELAECVGDRIPARICGAETRVMQLHLVARDSGDLRDPCTHCAGADHGDGRVGGQRGGHRRI